MPALGLFNVMSVTVREKADPLLFFMPSPFSMEAYSITVVRTYVQSDPFVLSVLTNGFRSISFEKVIVLNSFFYTQLYNHKIKVRFDLG